MTVNPVLKLIIFTGMFIIAGVAAGVTPAFVYYALSLALLGFILFASGLLKPAYLVLTATLGLTIAVHLNDSFPYPDRKVPPVAGVFKGEIKEVLKDTPGRTNVIAEGKMFSKHLRGALDCKVLFRIIRQGDTREYIPGDRIITKARLDVPGRPGALTRFDEREYLRSIDCDFAAISISGKIRRFEGGMGFSALVHKFRKALAERTDMLFTGANSAIIKALTIADRSDMDRDTEKMFSYSGTSHALSVSGLHVGVFAFLVFVCLGFFKRPWPKFWIFLSVIAGYVLITGFQPPAIRAAIMAGLILYIKTVQRKVQPLNILAFAILFVLIFDPQLTYSVGFRLSVLAVAGMILFYKRIYSLYKGDNAIVNFICASFAASISATVLSAPLATYYFGIYSFISPLSNLFIVPLMSLALVMAGFALAFSYVYFPLGKIFAISAEMFTDAAESVGSLSISLPGSYIGSPSAPLVAALISIFTIYLVYSATGKRFIFRFAVSAFAFILCLRIFSEQADARTHYVPFDGYLFAESKMEGNGLLVMIIDRKPFRKARHTYHVKNYLAAKKENLLICINGDSGYELTDELRKNRRFALKEVNLLQQEFLRKKLKLKEKLPQITDYENY